MTKYTPLKSPTKLNASLETYIREEILVDTYDESEVMSSWYSYLEDNIRFPFEAKIRGNLVFKKKAGSRLEATLLEMADFKYCGLLQMWALGHTGSSDFLFHFFLSDISEVLADDQTLQALRNWQYWVVTRS